jgi:YidC/Oxa1 family membrane protein insertase
MRYLKWIVISFVVLCGLLVVDSGIFNKTSQVKKLPILLQQTTTTEPQVTPNTPEAKDPNIPENSRLQVDASVSFGADNAPAKTIVLGAADPKTEDPKTGFEFQLELSSKGAAILRATFSDGNDNGFDNRNQKDPQPLQIVSPIIEQNGRDILAMANREFVLIDHKQQLPLQNLQWQSFDVQTSPDANSQSARFEAIIKNEQTGEQVIKVVKTYTVRSESYLLDCDITLENLSASEQNVRFNLAGPSGLEREGFRTDMRKVVAGFKNTDADGTIGREQLDKKAILKAGTIKSIQKENAYFLWAASVNKYFAFIAVPVPDEGKNYCDWLADKTGHLYNPDGDIKANSGDEMFGVDMKIAPAALAAIGQAGSSKTYKFQLYIGPKDKSLFNKNELYRSLGFDQTIDFMACCCPAGIIYPLAFGIMAMMKWMYGFIPNYGIVIIILVFLVRLVLHPITKKSQVSMSKMSKLGPMTEEIKKKYANNKAEMNKQIMALYKQQGASPIMGFLPMLVQMPILIALWSAIYTSIDLRGAPFLPFWITDLSIPDALFSFPEITIPILGSKISSLNLLPILMGVAMYFQQALMPTQAAGNPQVAQQQKIMKIMFPLMLPIILYNGPSGVNLYFMSSTFAGVIEQHVIRKHIRDKEEAESKGLVSVTKKTGGKVKKKKPKPFFKNM